MKPTQFAITASIIILMLSMSVTMLILALKPTPPPPPTTYMRPPANLTVNGALILGQTNSQFPARSR